MNLMHYQYIYIKVSNYNIFKLYCVTSKLHFHKPLLYLCYSLCFSSATWGALVVLCFTIVNIVRLFMLYWMPLLYTTHELMLPLFHCEVSKVHVTSHALLVNKLTGVNILLAISVLLTSILSLTAWHWIWWASPSFTSGNDCKTRGSAVWSTVANGVIHSTHWWRSCLSTPVKQNQS